MGRETCSRENLQNIQKESQEIIHIYQKKRSPSMKEKYTKSWQRMNLCVVSNFFGDLLSKHI